MPFLMPYITFNPFIIFYPHVFRIPYHLCACILLLQPLTIPPREFILGYVGDVVLISKSRASYKGFWTSLSAQIPHPWVRPSPGGWLRLTHKSPLVTSKHLRHSIFRNTPRLVLTTYPFFTLYSSNTRPLSINW